EGLRVEVLVARARELGAEEHRQEAADEEEDDGRDDVLDADHLVVGVDPEVVAPAAGAVTRVILGPARAAGGVVGPVVEAAEPDQEAERERDEADRGERPAFPDRVPVGGPADEAGEAEPEEAEQG